MSNKKANEIETKPENKRAIYRHILNYGPITKQGLYVGSCLSLPTIKQSLEFLIEKDLIDAADVVKNTGGRNAIAYKIKASGRMAMGISLTTNHITGVCVDLYGTVINMKRYRIPFDLHKDSYLKKIGEVVEELKSESPISDDRFLGVGIAIQSRVSENGENILYGMTHDFTGITREVLSHYIPYRTIMLHDASAAGFAEVWKNPNLHNAIYLNLNNSVGSCVIMNHTVYAGDNHLAGEIGHLMIEPQNGKKCYCGHYGCLDTVCNAGVLDSYCDGNLEQFFTLLKQKEPNAVNLWESYLNYLSIAIHNIRMLLDCPIIIGGYVGAHIEEYMNDLIKKVDRRTFFNTSAREYLLSCKYKNDATAAGAAIRLIDDFIESL